jgi:hypothetical protein
MANSRMTRINDAYQRILAMRQTKPANGQDSQAEADSFA